MRVWPILLLFTFSSLAAEITIIDNGKVTRTDDKRVLLDKVIKTYKDIQKKTKEEESEKPTVREQSVVGIVPSFDEICIECERTLKLSESVSSIIDALSKGRDTDDLLKNELQELEAIISITSAAKRRTEYASFTCPESEEMRFVESEDGRERGYAESKIVTSVNFPLDEIDSMVYRDSVSRMVLLKGQGGDRDKYVLVFVDKESNQVTIKYLKVENDIKRIIDNLPDLGYDDGTGTLDFSAGGTTHGETGKRTIKVGPMVDYKDNAVPTGIKVLDVDYENSDRGVKVRSVISDKKQEFNVDAKSDTFDTTMKFSATPNKQKVTLETPIETFEAKAKLSYNQDQEAQLTLDKKIAEIYSLKTVVTDKGEDTYGDLYLTKKDKLVLGVESDRSNKGNVKVTVPTTFNIFMSDYNVDGVTKVSASNLSGIYTLKHKDDEVMTYAFENNRTNNFKKHSISRSKQLDSGGTIGIKFEDVSGAPKNTNIINESTVWLNYSLKFK